jgi:hypothetical protein
MDSVDNSRVTANDAGGDDQAERIVKRMKRDNPYFAFLNDPQFLEDLRAKLSGKDTGANQRGSGSGPRDDPDGFQPRAVDDDNQFLENPDEWNSLNQLKKTDQAGKRFKREF